MNTRMLVYMFIERYTAKHGYGPSVRELATACSLSTSTIHHHIKKLTEQGRVTRGENGHCRTLQPATPPAYRDLYLTQLELTTQLRDEVARLHKQLDAAGAV